MESIFQIHSCPKSIKKLLKIQKNWKALKIFFTIFFFVKVKNSSFLNNPPIAQPLFISSPLCKGDWRGGVRTMVCRIFLSVTCVPYSHLWSHLSIPTFITSLYHIYPKFTGKIVTWLGPKPGRASHPKSGERFD